MLEKEKQFDYVSITDFTEDILDSMYNNSYDKFIVRNKNEINESSQSLINFLNSKDDSLILLLNSLLYIYMNSKAVDPWVLYHSRLYPIGKISDKNPEEHSCESEESKGFVGENENFKDQNDFLDPQIHQRMKTYNEHILMTYDEPQYDQEIMWKILNLVCTDPPFRQVTFRFLIMVSYYLTYHKDLNIWLHREEYEKLIYAYRQSIRSITHLYADFQVSQAFLEIFEYEYKNFSLWDDDKFKRIVRNPWIIIPIYDEKNQKNLPDILKTSDSKVQQIKDQIQRFLTLGHLLNKLNSEKLVLIFKDYPFKFEGRDVYSWEIGDVIIIDEDKTLVLCNIIEGKSALTRYIVLDPEFFILAEPNFDDGPYKTVKVCMKYSLKNIKVEQDPKKSSKMQVGVYEYDHDGDWKHSYFTLTFENSVNMGASKKTIENNQRQQAEFIDTQVYSFFDFCLDTIGEETQTG